MKKISYIETTTSADLNAVTVIKQCETATKNITKLIEDYRTNFFTMLTLKPTYKYCGLIKCKPLTKEIANKLRYNDVKLLEFAEGRYTNSSGNSLSLHVQGKLRHIKTLNDNYEMIEQVRLLAHAVTMKNFALASSNGTINVSAADYNFIQFYEKII